MKTDDWKPKWETVSGRAISSLVFSADGKTLLVGDERGDVKRGCSKWDFTQHPAPDDAQGRRRRARMGEVGQRWKD